MKRVRLLFLVESGTDVRIAEGLHERFDPAIYARAAGGREVSQPSSVLLKLDIGPASRLRFAASLFLRILRERKSHDFILAQGYSLAAFAANLAGRIARIPVAMLVCSPTEEYYRCRRLTRDSEKPFRWHEYALLHAFRKLNALVGKHYIVLSEYLGSVVRANRGAAVHVIPVYGVDTQVFRPAEKSRDVLRRLRGLPENEPILFFSSRVAPEKDAETLVRAVKIVRDGGLDVRILHRSGGYDAFLGIAEKAGARDLVIATDAVHPMRELPLDYAASDVCVQASRAEGLGFSPLEAFACGVPVIAAAVGGLRETIIDGETGWTYPAGDAQALAGCIERVLVNPEEANRRAETGRRMVQRRYERGKVFDELERVVTKIVSSRDGRPAFK